MPPRSSRFFQWIGQIRRVSSDLAHTHPRLPLLLLREIAGRRVAPRVPEEMAVMSDPESVRSFEAEAEGQSQLKAVHLYNARVLSHVIAGRRTVLDLGCGPGVLLSLLADLNPDIEFVGVDLSESMLARAESQNKKRPRPNLRFRHGDMTRLIDIPDKSVDAVVSSVALHHLPDFPSLDRCLAEAKRVLRSDGALGLIDLGRLKSARVMSAFARTVGANASRVFITDYENSLRASFRRGEWLSRIQRDFPSTVRVHTAGGLPVLHVIASPLKPLSGTTRALFETRRSSLSRTAGAAYRAVEGLMKWGGLILPE